MYLTPRQHYHDPIHSSIVTFTSVSPDKEYNAYPPGIILRFPEDDLDAVVHGEALMDSRERSGTWSETEGRDASTVPWHKQTLITSMDLIWAAGEILVINLVCFVFEAA